MPDDPIDDFARLALQRATRKAKRNPEALARKIEADWRAGGARAAAEIAEERSAASGVTVAAHRALSRVAIESRLAAHRMPHARACRCAADSSGCEALPSPSSEPYDRSQALQARRWIRPSLWASDVGLMSPIGPDQAERAEVEAETRAAHGMAYYFEAYGEDGWRNSVVVDRVRELYLEIARKAG